MQISPTHSQKTRELLVQDPRSRRVAATLGTTVAIQLLGIVTGALLARMLGVSGRGTLTALLLWPSLICYLGDIGGPTAYVYLAAGGVDRIRTLIKNVAGIVVAQSLILVVLGVPIVLAGLRRYGDIAWIGVAFLTLFVPLNLLVRYLNSLNQGSGNFKAFNLVRIGIQIVNLIGIIALFVGGSRDFGPVLLVMLASNAVVAALLLKQYPLPLSGLLALRRSTLNEIFSYGLRAHLGNLTLVDSLQVDLAIVVALLGAWDAGMYTVALSAALVVRAQGSALGMVTLASVAAAESTASRQEAAGSILRVGLILHGLTAAFIIISAGILVPFIYGSRFAPAVPIVRILALAMVAASIRQIVGDCLRGYGRPLDGTLAEVTGWAVLGALLLVLVPMLGIFGVATAVALSYVITLGVSLAFTKSAGISLSELLKPGRRDLWFGLDILKQMISPASSLGLSRRIRSSP